MGKGLAKLLINHQYEVFLGSRNPINGQNIATSLNGTVKGGSLVDATRFSNIIILAVPYSAVKQVLQAAGNLDGKILVDITNPLTSDHSGLIIGHSTSAAEEIAKLAPRSKVVKTFNHAFASTFQREPAFGPDKPTIFYCSDFADAKAEIDVLITDIGFDPIDAGPLKSARYLEPLAMLLIQLGFSLHMGTAIAFKLLRG